MRKTAAAENVVEPSRKVLHFTRVFIAGAALVAASAALNGQQALQLSVQWDKTTVVSKSTPTLQVVVNPPLRPGQPLSAASYKAVKELGADYVRYVPWLPYPKLAVAELEPPTRAEDLLGLQPHRSHDQGLSGRHRRPPDGDELQHHPGVAVQDRQAGAYPADPNQVTWDYTQGTELRDPSGKELGDYYGRLVSWYVNGGFTDENGVRHESGYHYKFPVWEVLNEVESEHSTTPEQYTERYDAIVEGIRRASPDTKFMGMALGAPSDHPEFFEYFLNPANHKPGIPLDYISYHFYAMPTLLANHRRLAVHLLRPGRWLSEHGSLHRGTSASGSRPRQRPTPTSWA